MKVAIITDIHFGARNDSLHFLDFYEKFYDETFFPAIDSAGINTLLILGDTFDRRKYVNFYSLQRAKKMFFGKLAARDIKVHMLVGNHDTYYKNTNDVNSPRLVLEEYENINIIKNPTTLQIEDISICMMPWICPENYDDSMATLKDTNATICMGHFEIEGLSHLKATYVKVVVVNKTNPYLFDTFINNVYLANPIDITIAEDFTELEDIEDNDVDQAEDTTTILNKYVDNLTTDLKKDKIKTLLKELYVEALNEES